MSKTVLWIAAVIIALATAYWVVQSIGPSDSEDIAVWKERAAVAEQEVERLKPELAAARVEASRVDTVIRTVLRNPPPVRPVTPPDTILVTVGTDSLVSLVNVLNAYSDTLERENVVLRATLDTAQSVFARYRLVADSTINVQQRQIEALSVVVDIQECRIARVLKCPSRKVAAIGAFILGGAAVAYVRR